MTIDRLYVRERLVLRVSGRMDVDSASQFVPACESCIADGFNNFVVDFGDLTYISSMGLRSLVTAAKKLNESGGKLRICRPTGLVRQVFEITRLNQMFELHDSVESALKAG